MTDHVCSGPYDLGPVCKHVVALRWLAKNRPSWVSGSGATKEAVAYGKPAPVHSRPRPKRSPTDAGGTAAINSSGSRYRPGNLPGTLSLAVNTRQEAIWKAQQTTPRLLRSGERPRPLHRPETRRSSSAKGSSDAEGLKTAEQQDYMPVFHACTAVTGRTRAGAPIFPTIATGIWGASPWRMTCWKTAWEPLPTDLRKDAA